MNLKILRGVFAAIILIAFLYPTHAVQAACARSSQGDADCDGSIGLSDFEIWRREYLGTISTKTSDFNSSGGVDLSDFNIWRINFTGGTSNPTPTIKITVTPTSQITPTPTKVNTTPTPTTSTSAGCTPPYPNGPWTTPISSNPIYLSDSASRISTITGVLSSNPTVFTMPVYEVTSTTPLKPVRFSGIYSNVTAAGTMNLQTGGGTVNVPIPNGAQQASGSDAQIILWNRTTGDEWAFWQFANGSSGATAKNGYHYNTNWSGVPPAGFASRGAGVPYLTGLIRPCEIKQGHIDHPIAFAFDSPQPNVFVYPATKTDGSGTTLVPEGARLQLDPTLSDNTITGWGCAGPCLIVAHAMQKYGMIVIDKAGHPKIYFEYEGTAHWNGSIVEQTVESIPLSKFKIVKPEK